MREALLIAKEIEKTYPGGQEPVLNHSTCQVIRVGFIFFSNANYVYEFALIGDLLASLITFLVKFIDIITIINIFKLQIIIFKILKMMYHILLDL